MLSQKTFGSYAFSCIDSAIVASRFGSSESTWAGAVAAAHSASGSPDSCSTGAGQLVGMSLAILRTPPIRPGNRIGVRRDPRLIRLKREGGGGSMKIIDQHQISDLLIGL